MGSAGVSPARRAALYIFLALGCLYAATGRFFIDNIDGETMYLTTRAMAQGRLWVEPELTTKLNLWPGRDGHLFSVHSVLSSVAALPFYYIGLGLTKLVPQLPQPFVLRAFYLLGPMLYTAATAAWLLLLLCNMGFSLRRSAFVALAYALGTLALPYAKYPFSEPLSALLTLGATWFAWRTYKAGGADTPVCESGGADTPVCPCRSAAWMGLFLGLAFLARHANAIIVPFFLLFILLSARPRTAALKPLIAACATFALGAAAWLWFNYARFGNPFMTGSETADFLQMQKPNTLRAAAFLLFSPGKGLFFYAPVMIMATIGFPYLYRRLPLFTLLIGTVTLAHLLFYASWPYYLGDWCWGPRFLVDILPLWIIPLAALPFARRWLRRTTYALLAISIVIQLLAVCIFYTRYFDVVVAEHGHVNWSYQQPLRTPLLGALRTARELRWYRLDRAQITSASRPGEGLKTEMRATLDLWPVYAWRFGMPWPIWLIWALQLALGALFLYKLHLITRQSAGATT